MSNLAMRWITTLVALGSTILAGPVLGQGDPVRGEQIYSRCIACHSLERDRTGPRHCGLLGRKAGSVPGFNYSQAMRDSGIVWTRQSLDAFLKDPFATIPGTFMGYAGVKDVQERVDLIAYLERANRSGICRAKQ